MCLFVLSFFLSLGTMYRILNYGLYTKRDNTCCVEQKFSVFSKTNNENIFRETKKLAVRSSENKLKLP